MFTIDFKHGGLGLVTRSENGLQTLDVVFSFLANQHDSIAFQGALNDRHNVGPVFKGFQELGDILLVHLLLLGRHGLVTNTHTLYAFLEIKEIA